MDNSYNSNLDLGQLHHTLVGSNNTNFITNFTLNNELCNILAKYWLYKIKPLPRENVLAPTIFAAKPIAPRRKD